MRFDNSIAHWLKPVRQFSVIYKGAEHSSRLLHVKNDGWQSKQISYAIDHWYRNFSLRICQSLYNAKPKAQSERCAPLANTVIA